VLSHAIIYADFDNFEANRDMCIVPGAFCFVASYITYHMDHYSLNTELERSVLSCLILASSFILHIIFNFRKY